MAESRFQSTGGAPASVKMRSHGGAFKVPSISAFRVPEAILFFLAILPGLFLLAMLNESCWQMAHRFMRSFPGLMDMLAGLQGRVALFIGLFLQISAVVWIETSYLHIWIKGRIRNGDNSRGARGRARKEKRADFESYFYANSPQRRKESSEN